MSINALIAKLNRQKALAQQKKAGASFTGTTEQIEDNVKPPVQAPVAQAVAQAVAPPPPAPMSATTEVTAPVQLNKNQVSIDLFNTEQRRAVYLAEEGASFCLIGGAGTGKTTTTRGVVAELAASGRIGVLNGHTDRVLRAQAPSVAVLSFTNQAVRNITEALPQEYKRHCSTIHRLLEYSPVRTTVPEIDADGQPTGLTKESMYYAPRYGTQPDGKGEGEFLPHLDLIILEESGSIPEDLFYTLLSAIPHPEDTQFIFLGDLNQMPPVFGDAILGFKLLELPTVELVETYRNVGLVTRLAQRILTGKPILQKELDEEWNVADDSGKLELVAFSKKLEWEQMLPNIGRHFKKLVLNEEFDMENDVLLVPFNKQLGTIEMNKYLMSGEDERLDRIIYHVMAGFTSLYLAIGDKVLHNKVYCRIVDIRRNRLYTGENVLHESKFIDRWGRVLEGYEYDLANVPSAISQTAEDELMDLEDLMSLSLDAIGEKVTLQASHEIVLEVLDDNYATPEGRNAIWTAKGVGELMNMLPVHAMTVHKAQGSEWRKVWGVLHHSHAAGLKRELLYTMVTRARQDITLYYTGNAAQHKVGGSAFSMGVTRQEIPGVLLDDKLNYFRKKLATKGFSHLKRKTNQTLKRKAAGL